MKASNKISSFCYPAITFICLVAFQIAMNYGLKIPHSIPDECGAMRLAAQMAGYDWSYIFEKSGLYYGSGTTLPFFFLFKMIKDPTVLYRAMLAVGCLWRTLPVFIIFPMARDYFEIKDDRIISLMSIAAIIGTPTRGSTIDNEPMLILTAWISAFLILKIIDRKNAKTLIRDLVLLVVVLAYSFTAHQRAIIYFPAALLTLIIAFAKPPKSKKKAVIIAAIFCLIVAGGALILKHIGIYLAESGNLQNNTIAAVLSWVPGLMAIVFSWNGFINSLILFGSNLWVMFVYFCGMAGLLFLIIPSMLAKTNAEKTDKEKAIIKMSVYPLLVFLIFLFGLGFLWNETPQLTREAGAELSKGYFYLRYTGSIFGICMFLTMCFIIRYGFKRSHLAIALVSALVCFRLTYVVSLEKAFENENYGGDAFNFFGPLSFSDSTVFSNGKTAFYYILPTLIASLILILIYVIAKKGYLIWIPVILSAVMIYQYSYILFMRDLPDSQMYFAFVDKLYDVKKEYPECFDNVGTVYYCSEYEGLVTNSQIILKDVPLINEYPEEISDNMVILTNNTYSLKDVLPFDMGSLSAYRLDENEVIYTNCDPLKQQLSDYLNEEK